MLMEYIHPEVVNAVPGVIGSAVALRWVIGTHLQRFIGLLGGAAISYYAAPYMSEVSSLDIGLTKFMLGLFGMSVVAKVFESLESLRSSELVERVLKKFGF